MPKGSSLRAIIRLLGLVFMALIMVWPAIVLWCFTLERIRGQYVRWFYAMAGRICGIKLTIEGAMDASRPLLLLANHSSYLDIFVLGCLKPMSFTPKSEIRSWPVIGFFCVLADCVFIERRPAAMEDAQAAMQEKLSQGKIITLFPEGTTGDGFTIKPFKSGFLNMVETHELPIQPVSVAYTHVGDVPLSAQNRQLVVWIDDATLVAHAFRLLKQPCVRVTVTYYPALHRGQDEDRKEIAKRCEEIITTGLHQRLEAAGVTS